MTSPQRLFLFEFLISKIKIDLDALTTPKLQDLLIHFRCPDFLFLDVTPEEFTVESMKPDVIPSDGVYRLDFGKTYLFPFTSEKMISILQSSPLEIDLRIARKTVGSATFAWKKDFIEMVGIFEAIGVVKSVTYNGTFDMISLTKKSVGQVDISIKMSCLGVSAETYFCLQKQGAIFMSTRSDVQFKCEKFNFNETTVPPVGSIYNPMLSTCMSTTKLSWTELFGCKLAEAKQSIAPIVIDMEDVCRPYPSASSRRQQQPPPDLISHGSQYDIVSMVFRPPENKFFDFLNMMRAEVNTKEEETVVTLAIDKPKKPTTAFSDDVRIHGRENSSDEPPAPTELTADKINRTLCKHKDCPAAKKFKEYGLGPLATGSGLGTLYDIVEPPVTYGLSHTYGYFDHYGPYGCFRRPKDPNQPYYPPAHRFHVEPDKSQNRCPCQRLRGGCTKRIDKNGQQTCLKLCKHQVPYLKSEPRKTLRLRGGGFDTVDTHVAALQTCQKIVSECDKLLVSFRETQVYQKNVRLRGGGGFDTDLSKCIAPKSAITECKPIMDQFDTIVNAYKKALGPCGEATCPYAPNVIEDHCRDYCKKIKLPEPPKEESCESIPCRRDICPYTEKSYLAGCGSAKCAYAKYKTGLVDDDAALELMFLPAPVADPCGHPKCQYPPYTLPPIHWDCPEPLPKENCKNPNCPHQPPELKAIKCPPPIPQPRGPCGSISCPYALPSPCDNPSCPFRQKPCPYNKRKNRGDSNPTCDPDSDEVCDNPKCPLKKQSSDDLCKNPECPFKQKELDYCGNPTCPSAPKLKKKKSGSKNCGSPNCPFNPNVSISSNDRSVCSNPKCPFAQKKKKKKICDNPACPYAQKNPKRSSICHNPEKKGSICDNPECPYAQKKNSICGNPECPYAQKQNDISDNPDFPFALNADSVCSNPECPYAQKSGGKNSFCSNLDCPYALKIRDKDSVCSNPDCPYAKKQDIICDNPTCPFAKKPKKKSYICDNPSCPFAESTESDSVCNNPNCPFAKLTVSSICSNPDCSANKPKISCDNPECTFKRSENPYSFCSNPNCPFFKRGGSGDAGDTACSNPLCPYSKNYRNPTYCGDPSCPRGDAAKCGQIETLTETIIKASSGQTETKKELEPRKKIKRRGRFVYSIGDKYPGVKIGHRHCVTPRHKVPPFMGWLWNKVTPILHMKPRRGWRPGAIERTIAQRIEAHRNAKGLGKLTLPKFPFRGARGRTGASSTESVNVKPRPTLHIQKKEGTYFITMNPLKDPKTLAENEDPYMDCTPMQFKITKPKKNEDGRLCHCDDEPESSSDSELDIEFTPPAGIIHPERFKKKRNIANCDTQYDDKDFAKKKDKGKKGKKGKGGKGKGKCKAGKVKKGKKK